MATKRFSLVFADPANSQQRRHPSERHKPYPIPSQQHKSGSESTMTTRNGRYRGGQVRGRAKPYHPDMNLWGRGKDPLGKKKQHNPFKNSHWKKGQQKQQQQQVWYERGSGTVSDPYVAWLFDCCMEDDLSEIAMLDQTSIVHKVARANGFSCALIRKGSHDKQCVYDNFGTRITTTAPNGNIVAELVDCDPHITLYMGWDCHTAMVSGHIYVMEVADLQAGRVVVKQIDNPDTQRRIVHKGYDRVAEEFWLLGGVYEKR